jgi:anti-sigma regulatory factor (Ser/Thr protein kinase)
MATLKLFADDCQLALIRDFVAQVGEGLGLDEQVIYELQLAVDEACSNVIEHGYGGRGGEIEVTIEPTEDGIQVMMRDWGNPFDPDAVPIPDVTAPLENRKLGGLGLFLMRKMMDDVRFEFDRQQGNTLTMMKRRRKEGK